MPTVKCKCGSFTNTVFCTRNKKGKIVKCFAKFEKNRWFPGCAYAEVEGVVKEFVDDIIQNGHYKI